MVRTRLTADLLCGVYVLATALRVTSGRWTQAARTTWIAGAALLVVHVVTAYGEAHGWSHAAAVEHTRQETLRRTGWDSGVGIWVNFVTVGFWLAEAMRLLRQPIPEPTHRAPSRFAILAQSWIAFMMVQSSIVFADAPLRWVALAAALILLSMLAISRRQRNTPPSDGQRRASRGANRPDSPRDRS